MGGRFLWFVGLGLVGLLQIGILKLLESLTILENNVKFLVIFA